MPNAQHCLAMADEAERLAAIVSYGRDKVRLKQQADRWREQAQAAEVTPVGASHPFAAKPQASGVLQWLRRGRV